MIIVLHRADGDPVLINWAAVTHAAAVDIDLSSTEVCFIGDNGRSEAGGVFVRESLIEIATTLGRLGVLGAPLAINYLVTERQSKS